MGQIMQLIDSYTKENVNYEEVTTWHDGTAMSDAKVDNVIYRKKGEKYFKMCYAGPINASWFGVKGDGITDNAMPLNNAVTFLAKTGGGKIVVDFGTYKIDGTILIPSNIIIDWSKSVIIGNSNNILFETAYLEGENVIQNEGKPISHKYNVYNSTIENCVIKGSKLGFRLSKFLHGCSLRSVEFLGCYQSILAKECFYSTYVDVVSRMPTANNNLFAYHFTNENNAIKMQRCTASVKNGFLFEGGTTALVLDTCTTEGGEIGLKFKGECHGVNIIGQYAELVKKAIDLSEVAYGTFNITGGTYGRCDVVLDGTDYPGKCWGSFDDSNSITNAGYTHVDGYVYRGLVKANKPRFYMRMTLPSDQFAELPPNYEVGEHQVVKTSYNHKFSNSQSTGVEELHFGIIPQKKRGDTGYGIAGTINGCTHHADGTSDNFFIAIDTKIKWRPITCSIRFNFAVTVGGTTRRYFGDIFGDIVKNMADDGNIVQVVNNNDYYRLKITGLSSADMTYLIQGNIQIV